MANNFNITEGSGKTIAAFDNGTALEQQVRVTVAPTTPITATSLPLPTGAATDASISATQPRSITNFPASQAVTGTFFQATQPVSLTSTTITGVVAVTESGTWIQQTTPAPLTITATGVAAAAVTATLPAVAGQFHYITGFEIVAYSTVARVGAATPVIVTSTNLSGNNAWTFATAAGIGTTDTKWYQTASPIRSAVVNTATTIVCPATASIIWRVNVFYFTAA